MSKTKPLQPVLFGHAERPAPSLSDKVSAWLKSSGGRSLKPHERAKLEKMSEEQARRDAAAVERIGMLDTVLVGYFRAEREKKRRNG